MPVARGGWSPLCGRRTPPLVVRRLVAPPRPASHSTAPSPYQSRPAPHERVPGRAALRQDARAWRRMPVLVHDGRDESRHLLVPGLDPWAVLDEQDLAEGARVKHQEHQDIHLLGDIAIA